VLGRRELRARDLAHLVALYDGEIRWTDEVLGRVLDGLDRRGRLADAIVVVTADHGEEFFEHGARTRARTSTSRPCACPCSSACRAAGWGRRCDLPVSLTDLAPTLAAAAGAPLPAGWMG
jgi:arylsulfatase A-like enzyme